MQLISYSLGGKAGLYADLQRQQAPSPPPQSPPMPAAGPGRGRFLQGPRNQPAVAASLARPLQHHGGPARRSPNRRAIPGKPN